MQTAGRLIAPARATVAEDGAQEGARPLLLGVGEQHVGRALLPDLPPVEEADAVGDFAGKAHLVGHQQHGQVVLLGELADDVQDLADEFRVEGRGGLVEQHDLGAHGQRPGDADALLLAAGELCRELVRLVLEPDQRQQLLRPLARLLLRQLEHGGWRLGDVAHHRHVREQVELLKHHAEQRAPVAQVLLRGRHQLAVAVLVPQRLAVDGDDAAIDALERHQDAQHGRFARARRPDDRHLLAARHAEIEFVEHDVVAEALDDLVEGDDRLAHLRGSPVLGRLTSTQRTTAEATSVRMR